MTQVVGGDGSGFDGHDPGGPPAHGEPEEPSPGVGVEQCLAGSGRQGLRHQSDQYRGAGGVALEEGVTGDAELHPGHRLDDGTRSHKRDQLLPVPLHDAATPARRLRWDGPVDHRQEGPGGRRHAQGEGRRVAQVAETRDQIGQRRVEQRTCVDGLEQVAAPSGEGRPAVGDLEVHPVPVAEWGSHRHRVPHRWVLDPAEVSQLPGEDSSLPLQLGGVVGELPLAPATGAEQRAGRFDPVRRRRHHLAELHPRPGSGVLGDHPPYPFPGHGSVDEVGLALEAAYSLPAVGDIGGLEIDHPVRLPALQPGRGGMVVVVGIAVPHAPP